MDVLLTMKLQLSPANAGAMPGTTCIVAKIWDTVATTLLCAYSGVHSEKETCLQ